MNITPLNGQVLVKPTTEEEKLSGLVLPDAFRQDRPNSGTVLLAGPKAKAVKKGQGIYFNPYAGEIVEIEGDKLVLISIDEIYATYHA